MGKKVMPCPKCDSLLIREDGVIFCSECLHVLQSLDLDRRRKNRSNRSLPDVKTEDIVRLRERGASWRWIAHYFAMSQPGIIARMKRTNAI